MAKRRKSGEGTVRQRKDGRWEGRVVIGYDEKGLPKTKNVLAKTKTECVEKLEALKETVGSSTPDKCTSDMSFGDWMDFLYQNYSKISLRPSTQAGYENHIYKHIIPSLGRIPLNKLTQNDLQVFYANLKKKGRVNRTEIYGEGLSDRSVRACHGCCRTALDKAVAEKLIRVNPAGGCKLPPKRGKEMQILTSDEMQRNAAQKIDQAFGSRVPAQDEVRKDACMDSSVNPKPTQLRFEPYKGIRRKPGTGCISQISETTWEGRYSSRVNGKKVTRNVYAGSLEECEVKLAEMIREMKAELGRK